MGRALGIRGGSQAGFTLVELLVVLLILGILAAIAIPAFFNQRTKAQDSEAKATVKTAQTALETYATDNNGSYAGATSDPTAPYAAGSLQAIEQSLGDVGDRLTVVAATDDTYTVQVESEVGATQLFRISRAADGTTTSTCDVDGTAGCPSNGQWD